MPSSTTMVLVLSVGGALLQSGFLGLQLLWLVAFDAPESLRWKASI